MSNRTRDFVIRNYHEMEIYADKTCEVCGGKFAVNDEIHLAGLHARTKYYHKKHWEKLLY